MSKMSAVLVIIFSVVAILWAMAQLVKQTALPLNFMLIGVIVVAEFLIYESIQVLKEKKDS